MALRILRHGFPYFSQTARNNKQVFNMKILSGLIILLFTFGCANVVVTKDDDQAKMICKWGTQKFDLCQFDTQEEKVEAVLLEMDLDEKIGQMTQSFGTLTFLRK
jgi:hypothetical protein